MVLQLLERQESVSNAPNVKEEVKDEVKRAVREEIETLLKTSKDKVEEMKKFIANALM